MRIDQMLQVALLKFKSLFGVGSNTRISMERATWTRKCHTLKNCPGEWAQISTDLINFCMMSRPRRTSPWRLSHLVLVFGPGHRARIFFGLIPSDLFFFSESIFSFASFHPLPGPLPTWFLVFGLVCLHTVAASNPITSGTHTIGAQ